MGMAVDIAGQRFGKLTAVSFRSVDGEGRIWHCQCDCGGSSVVRTSQLRDGSNRSCGCMRAGVFIECMVCGKEARKKPHKPGKFCSHECYWKNKIGRGTENWNFGKGGYTTKGKGKKRGPRPVSTGIKLKAWWEARRGQKRSRSYPSGEGHPCWKGGCYSSDRRRIMGSGEYARLLHNVFSRDDYTCSRCKVRGGELHMDHIKPWATHAALRLEPTNCRTLCRSCHFFITFNRVMPKGSKWGLGFNTRFNRKEG